MILKKLHTKQKKQKNKALEKDNDIKGQIKILDFVE